MTRLHLTTILVASFGFAACTGDLDETPPENEPPPGATTGGEDTTFDHQNDGPSVWEIIDRLSKEGPPSFTARCHSCAKLRFATLGNVLTSLGVNVANTAPVSAG